jgi:3-oxoacyl-[acyl-carrier-protein] synthase II
MGIGLSADAHHITAPPEDGSGAALAMRRALQSSAIPVEEIDYINAHGTSTPIGDLVETRAIRAVFGDRAYGIPISSTKSMLGHSLGATAAIEAVICVLALREGIVPPTINLTHPDPECDLDYVPHEARMQPIRLAMSNSFGFGGANTSLILRRWDEVA